MKNKKIAFTQTGKDRPEISVGFLPRSEEAFRPLYTGRVPAHAGEEEELTLQHSLWDGAAVCPGLLINEVLQQPDEKGLRESRQCHQHSPRSSKVV